MAKAADDTEKKDDVIEVFPTTPQLFGALIFTAVMLVALIVIRFLGAAGVVHAPPESEPPNYFNRTTMDELALHEAALIARINRARGIEETPAALPSASDAQAAKLDSALETLQSEKLAGIYSALSDPEKEFVIETLSDWKLSRMLSVMEAQAAAEIVTRLAPAQSGQPAAEETPPAEAAAPATGQ
ncbi:MAG: hypothetical protein HRF49_08770 [bacterium]|jgi:hypothetical protein